MAHRSVADLLRGLRGGQDGGGRRSTPLPAPVAKQGAETKLRHLSAIDIFRDLQQEDLDWLAAHTTMITARRGQLVYMPGETSEALFLLKAGRIRIYRLSADGKKLVLSTLDPETFFGDMPLAGQQMYGAFAEALDDCTLCVLGRADLERLIETRPRVAIRLLEVVGRRLVEAESASEELAFKSIPARLATLLLRLSDANRGDALVGHTHQDLAEMIGTYRETATQTLDDFKRRGLVDLGRKHIRILDRSGLQAVGER
jgi:CRP/FNR family transcriptional regulator, cyclic AMP receptor protein